MNEDAVLELTYKNPTKRKFYSDPYRCWICGIALAIGEGVYSRNGNGSFRYCSSKCKVDHNNLKSGWKP